MKYLVILIDDAHKVASLETVDDLLLLREIMETYRLNVSKGKFPDAKGDKGPQA